MKRYSADILSDITGLSLIGATLDVFVTGTETRVTLYKDDNQDGDTISQPVPNGTAFYAPDGRYDLRAHVAGQTRLIPAVDMFDGFEQNRRLEAVENGEPSAPGSLRADLLASAGSGRVSYRRASAGANARTLASLLDEGLSVKSFGAIGDGTLHTVAEWIVPSTRARFSTLAALQVEYPHVTSAADSIDWAAMQATNNTLLGTGGGTIAVPGGRYVLNRSLVPGDHMTWVGIGGHNGSLIIGYGIDLFKTDKLDFGVWRGLAFTGAGSTGFRQTVMPANMYWANVEWSDCHFYGDLFDCVTANMIFYDFYRNTMGYFGNVVGRHRHITSIGSTNNIANCGTLEQNRFYHARDGHSVRIENGGSFAYIRNNAEQNAATPIILRGVQGHHVEGNFFEKNSRTDCIIDIAVGAVLIDNKATVMIGNNYVPLTPGDPEYDAGYNKVSAIVKTSGELIDIVAIGNTGNLTGIAFASDMAKVSMSVANTFTGFDMPNFLRQQTGLIQLNDASGAGLTLIGGSSTYERVNQSISFHVSVTYPATTNQQAAKLGGLPFPAMAVSTGQGLGGIDVATDGGASTMTLFVPGTLTPLTNAQLSGKTIYLSMFYRKAA